MTHTWSNVVDNPGAISAQSGTVVVPGFAQGSYSVRWHDPYTGDVLLTESKSVDASGNLRLSVVDLATDVAVKVSR
jgi:hypothetical protein